MIRSVPARAVVDTNIVVSALLARRGVPAAIIDALLRDRFRLVLSAELMAEYAEVLSRPYLVRRLKVSAIEIDAGAPSGKIIRADVRDTYSYLLVDKGELSAFESLEGRMHKEKALRIERAKRRR